MPAIKSLDILDLIYYVQALLFTIMSLALSLDEVEKTYSVNVISQLATQTL
jgi:hypothetical protein